MTVFSLIFAGAIAAIALARPVTWLCMPAAPLVMVQMVRGDGEVLAIVFAWFVLAVRRWDRGRFVKRWTAIVWDIFYQCLFELRVSFKNE